VFCKKKIYNIEKHLKINHIDEASIQVLFANLDKNSDERKILLQNIIDDGNNEKGKKEGKIINKNNNIRKSKSVR
jgi:hypothetical protein